MNKNTGIYRVRWWTSPVCAHILETLECRGERTPEQLQRAIGAQHTYTLQLLRLLRDAGIVRVSAYRHNVSGSPTPMYRLGPGKSVPKPAPETASQRSARRWAALKEQYGCAGARIILNKYRGRLVRDGRTIRPGDHEGQLVGRVAR